jgi:tetratricopeptide (TPR) repeat protein
VHNGILDPQPIRQELARLLAHRLFARASVLRDIVAFLVEEALQNRRVEEVDVASAVFDIPPGEFHPYKNANVRVQMRNLRLKLEAYYLAHPDSAVRFKLVGYEVVFELADAVPPEARRALNEARCLLDSRFPEDLVNAAKILEAILVSQPEWANAWETLNYIQVSMAAHGAGPPRRCLQFAGESADRALALAPNSGQAHAAKASVEAMLHWNWTAAENLYKRAVELDPKVKYDGWYHAYLVARGKPEVALAWVEESMSVLDRPRPSFQTNLGILQYLCRRLDVAESELHRAHKLNPDDWSCLAWLAVVQWNRGSYAKAAMTQTKSMLAARRSPPGQYFELANEGLLGTPRPLRLSEEHQGGVSEVGAMVGAAIFHNWNRAIESIERMLEARYPMVHFFPQTPLFDPLWQLPRFRALFAATGLPEPKHAARSMSA